MTKNQMKSIIATLDTPLQETIANLPAEHQEIMIDGIMAQCAREEASALDAVPAWLMAVLDRCRAKLVFTEVNEKQKLATAAFCNSEDVDVFKYSYRTHLRILAEEYGDAALRAYARMNAVEPRMNEGAKTLTSKLRDRNPLKLAAPESDEKSA